MAKISKTSETCIRNMTIATWQGLVTAENAFYKIYENEQDMSNDTAKYIMELLELTASRKTIIVFAVEDIIDLIEN